MIKKEIKDEVTHILYDQTRRTPIVIPVVNEVGGAVKAHGRAPQTKTCWPAVDAAAVRQAFPAQTDP